MFKMESWGDIISALIKLSNYNIIGNSNQMHTEIW